MKSCSFLILTQRKLIMARNSNNRSNRNQNRNQNHDQDVLNALVNVTPENVKETTMNQSTPNQKMDVPPAPTVDMLYSANSQQKKWNTDPTTSHVGEFHQISYQLYNNTRPEKMSAIVGVERSPEMKDIKGKADNDKLIDVFILDRSVLRIVRSPNNIEDEVQHYRNMTTGYNQSQNLLMGQEYYTPVFYKHNTKKQECYFKEDGQTLLLTIQKFDLKDENKFLLTLERPIGKPLFLEVVYRTTKDSDRSDEHLNSILGKLIGNMTASIMYAIKNPAVLH